MISLKACIYARKSTNKINQNNTIENQKKICERYAELNQLEIVDVKVDISTGRDDINRPEIKNLIQDGVNGKYQCVIMKGISRLYRDTEKGLALIKKLHMNGIRVITVEEGFDSTQNLYRNGALDTSKITIYLMFAEMESSKIAERVKLTQIEKAKRGMWNNPTSVPYGYEYDPNTKKLVVEHESAEVIRSIFQMYENGFSVAKIAERLEKENKKPPKSIAWREDSLRYILRNQVYKGIVSYRVLRSPQKQNSFKETEIVIVENAHESIIDKEKFDSLQLILDSKAINKGNKNKRSKLNGLVKCSSCGSSMTYRKYLYTSEYYYYCSGYIKHGKSYCSSHKVKGDVLENEVLFQTEQYLNTFKEIEQIKLKYILIKNKINNLESQFDCLLNALIQNKITDDYFNEINQDLAEELDLLINKKQLLGTKIIKYRYMNNLMNKHGSIVDVMYKDKNVLEQVINNIKVSEAEIIVEFKK